MIAYNPLAGGVLTGRYQQGQDVEAGSRLALDNSGPMSQRRYWNDVVFAQIEGLKAFFEARGKSLTHVALAWVLAQPDVTYAILGASKPPVTTCGSRSRARATPAPRCVSRSTRDGPGSYW